MPKKIELLLDGTTATAVLHETSAPKTIQKVWDALPIEETLRHVRWSGTRDTSWRRPCATRHFP